MINPAVVEGQIRGGIAQGIGGMLLRALGLRRRGPIPVRNVHDLPACPPPWRFQRSRSTTLPRDGRRGRLPRGGEGGAIIAPAAIANAVEDALDTVWRDSRHVPVDTHTNPRADRCARLRLTSSVRAQHRRAIVIRTLKREAQPSIADVLACDARGWTLSTRVCVGGLGASRTAGSVCGLVELWRSSPIGLRSGVA